MTTVDAFVAGYIQRWEGGLSLDPNDAGNWSSGQKGVGALLGSNFGVTGRTLAAFRGHGVVTAHDIATLTLSEAVAIARKLFYADAQLDRLAWNRVTASVLDFGWGAGPYTAKRLLQDMLDCTPDGQIGVGGQTATAYAAFVKMHGEEFAAGAWWMQRESYYERLTISRPSDGIYLRGWDNRSRWFTPGEADGWWAKAA